MKLTSVKCPWGLVKVFSWPIIRRTVPFEIEVDSCFTTCELPIFFLNKKFQLPISAFLENSMVDYCTRKAVSALTKIVKAIRVVLQIRNNKHFGPPQRSLEPI